MLKIPYGVLRVNIGNLARVPTVYIDLSDERPFRLGDGQYGRREFINELLINISGPEGAGDESPGESRVRILHQVLLRDCDVFDKNLRFWVDLYFKHIRAQALSNAEQLEKVFPLDREGVDPLFWAMAAPRPLIRAHLLNSNERFVSVDVAFWNGKKVLALIFDPRKRDQKELEYLNDTELVNTKPPLDDNDPHLIYSQLGEFVSCFWRGLLAPPDPFFTSPFRHSASRTPFF